MRPRPRRGIFRRKRSAAPDGAEQLHALATVIVADVNPLECLRSGEPSDPSYDAVLYAIEALIQAPHRVVVVTGVSASAASTEVATGLALVAAAAGRRVVLIDANLGTDDVAGGFGIDDSIGLSEVLAGTAGLGDAVARPVEQRDLLVIPAGKHSAQLAGPLPPDTTTSLLEYLATAAQLVIIDSDAEALGVPGSGWGPLADGVVLIADRRATGGSHGAAVAATIRETGAHVLGLVRTRPPGTSVGSPAGQDLFDEAEAEADAVTWAPAPEETPAPDDAQPAEVQPPEPEDAEPDEVEAPEPDEVGAPEPDSSAEPDIAEADRAAEPAGDVGGRGKAGSEALTTSTPPDPPRKVAGLSGAIESTVEDDRAAFTKPELMAAARRQATPAPEQEDHPPPGKQAWRSRPRHRRLRRGAPTADHLGFAATRGSQETPAPAGPPGPIIRSPAAAESLLFSDEPPADPPAEAADDPTPERTEPDSDSDDTVHSDSDDTADSDSDDTDDEPEVESPWPKSLADPPDDASRDDDAVIRSPEAAENLLFGSNWLASQEAHEADDSDGS